MPRVSRRCTPPDSASAVAGSRRLAEAAPSAHPPCSPARSTLNAGLVTTSCSLGAPAGRPCTHNQHASAWQQGQHAIPACYMSRQPATTDVQRPIAAPEWARRPGSRAASRPQPGRQRQPPLPHLRRLLQHGRQRGDAVGSKVSNDDVAERGQVDLLGQAGHCGRRGRPVCGGGGGGGWGAGGGVAGGRQAARGAQLVTHVAARREAQGEQLLVRRTAGRMRQLRRERGVLPGEQQRRLRTEGCGVGLERDVDQHLGAAAGHLQPPPRRRSMPDRCPGLCPCHACAHAMPVPMPCHHTAAQCDGLLGARMPQCWRQPPQPRMCPAASASGPRVREHTPAIPHSHA